MKVTDQINSILQHPFTKQAIRKFNSGNDEDIKYLLFVAIKHVSETTRYNCLRLYRDNKRLNYPLIIEAINTCPLPSNLNLELPIVPIQQDCKIVTLVPKVKVPKNYRIPNQLEIEFKTKKATQKVALILQEA